MQAEIHQAAPRLPAHYVRLVLRDCLAAQEKLGHSPPFLWDQALKDSPYLPEEIGHALQYFRGQANRYFSGELGHLPRAWRTEASLYSSGLPRGRVVKLGDFRSSAREGFISLFSLLTRRWILSVLEKIQSIFRHLLPSTFYCRTAKKRTNDFGRSTLKRQLAC